MTFVGHGYVEEVAWELPEVAGDEEDILNLGEVCTLKLRRRLDGESAIWGHRLDVGCGDGMKYRLQGGWQ